ncbi:M20/M25/M40 family metallo-hydrolase [Arthrobacter crystallopoietes]|uniref:Acetylornithine deacetylase/Succinyl-diaminopimelate desuccinylase n=1 Tax=Crystallibacter crystallopoietes TaxID=37928 RepID=A0A1H1C0F4_9MICC|nr:M20/M25/M40 family metallo-hydrolase [Arthrobacter crystallopoietes]AUI50930.1 zinc metalloprotein [Arthrobacter crystallopoietes]SDQ57693.1 Acetylornithine deacetylase/Succinyl-diaminopimelate desuccinylase [Arthrobacter crystallopoietes]
MNDSLDATAVTSSPLGRRTFLGVAALGATGLASTSLLSGATTAKPAAAATLVPEADKDPLNLLQRMLSFDTQNSGSGANTRPHAEMLKAIWDNAGVPAEIIDTPQPNNVHLIARIPGTGSAKPLLILGHSDVVPVERENWSVDPFSGEVRNGEVYGRGALDMKGANSATISALLRHVSEGARFDRDIIVLTDCDEEAGSFGSRWLAANHWDKLDAGMVLTEGGWFLAQKDQTSPMLITATRQDKVYFNLDLTASGIATHSSKPNPEAAIVTLSRAVAELGDWLAPVHLTPVTRDYFAALAKATDDAGFTRAIELMLSANSQQARERAARVVVSKSSYPWLHQALLRTTHAFVIEDAGYKENVIPSSAHVRVNCRAVPGGQKPREFLEQVRELMADRGIEVALAAPEGTSEEQYLNELDETWATPPADIDTPLYGAISEAATETYPDAVFAPALFEAGTSLAPWRQRGIPGYGVYPYVLNNEQLIAMHGNDERIYVEALQQGTDFMYRMFARFLS